MGRKILPSLAVLFLSLFFGLCGYVLSSNRPDEGYDSIAVEYSRLHGLNPNLTRAVIEAEQLRIDGLSTSQIESAAAVRIWWWHEKLSRYWCMRVFRGPASNGAGGRLRW